jgi:adenylate cyclase, class 2
MQPDNPEVYLDVNVKARCAHPEIVEAILLKHAARFVGEDFQVDTFFSRAVGKNNLREGNIEYQVKH